MSSKILRTNAALTSRSMKPSGPTANSLFENVSSLNETEADQVALYENLSHFHRHANNHQSIIYDVPKSNECIYAQPKSNAAVSVDSLIPEAARLLLAQNNCKNRHSYEVEEEEIESEEFDVVIEADNQEGGPEDDYELFTSDGFRDNSFNDFGLEVIQEETESQMSSSESEHELDNCVEFCSETLRQRKDNGINGFDIIHNLSPTASEVLDFSSSSNHNNQKDNGSHEEIVSKHIKIPSEWDPKPMLSRLYAMVEPKNSIAGHSSASLEIMAGHMQILSGNRRKGTFWNAWRRKYCVLTSGKLTAYEKDNCEDIFQSIQLSGGKVDFLDPVEYVGIEKGKSMVNKIIGVDDGNGHYYVFQCGSTGEAAKWAEAVQQETTSTDFFVTPILPRSLSIFRDIVVIDIGSTNMRAGVLTHQPTLPSKFFSSVMSVNEENGNIIYGNDVYLPDNRKNAKIRYPFESSSKLCQNTLDVVAMKGFFKKIFFELNIRVENYRVVVNLPRRVDSSCRKKILQMLFNDFDARSAILYHQSLVAFWAHSIENGIVCDVGERCDIIPMTHGFVLSHAWKHAPLGGSPLKHSLRQGLGPQENGLYLSTPAENLVLRFISENFICVNGGGAKRPSQDSEEIVVEMDLRDVLPFSNLIGVNQDVLRGVAEGFFDPGFYGLDCEGLPKLLLKSIQSCDVDVRKEASQNIFLSGGCSLIPGFAERLEVELTKLCPSHLKPKIRCSPYRYHASFIGSSVLAGNEAFEKSVMKKADYDDGPGPSYWLI